MTNNRDYYIPSAIPFFIFGFIYYLVIPFFIYIFYPEDNFLLRFGTVYYYDNFFSLKYFIDLSIIFLSFYLAYFLFSKVKIEQLYKNDLFSKLIFGPKIFFFILFSFLLLLIFKGRSSGIVYFSGYSSYNIEVLGPFVTFVFLSTWFYVYFSTKLMKIIFFILFIISSLIILGLGSRMFFILGVITIGINYIYDKPGFLKSYKLKIVILFVISFVLFIGVWRDGSVLDLNQFIGVLFAEPYFTLTSASTYFKNYGGRPYVGDLRDILASAINFIPSLLFPNKIEMINKLTYNEFKSSPFGASSILVNLYTNFGFFYPVFLFVIGGFYGLLYKVSHYSIFYRAVYFSILPLLMFHFFREGFITVLKVMIYNGLILPAIIILVFKFLVLKKVS